MPRRPWGGTRSLPHRPWAAARPKLTTPTVGPRSGGGAVLGGGPAGRRGGARRRPRQEGRRQGLRPAGGLGEGEGGQAVDFAMGSQVGRLQR
jgi:hypothetical protein